MKIDAHLKNQIALPEGMTKRQYIATQVFDEYDYAETAINFTDALLKQLGEQ